MRRCMMAALYPHGGFNPNTGITYTGSYLAINDGGGNWRIKFLTSGTLTFLKEPGNIDLFLVGGGGGGALYYGGGGGGYVNTQSNISVIVSTGYSISIGSGGGNQGGVSRAFGYSAAGGYKYPGSVDNGDGGNGGSGGGGGAYSGTAGNGGENGSDGQASSAAPGGYGDHVTTREFQEAGGDLYAGGGAGNSRVGGTDGQPGAGGGGAASSNGVANTGGGGGGGGGTGGSGIVIIRNHRAA